MRQTRESGVCGASGMKLNGKNNIWHYAKDMRSVGIFVLGIVAAA